MQKLLSYLLIISGLINWFILSKYIMMREITPLQEILSSYINFSFVIPLVSTILIKSFHSKKQVPSVILKLNYFVNLPYLFIYVLGIFLLLMLKGNA